MTNDGLQEPARKSVDRPHVAVIILNWNKSSLTKRCLDQANATTGLDPLFIVVDNGSSPPMDSPDDKTILIRNPRNLGFAGGANVGIQCALDHGADYIWLLNNDADPLPGTLDTLVQTARADAGIGLLSPIILNSDAGDAVDWHGSFLHNGTYDYTSDPTVYGTWLKESPRCICLTGAALLLTRDLVEKIGAFDERFFAYWEDTDLSLRAGEAGYKALVVPGTAVRHACGTESLDLENRPPYYYYLMCRNELLILRKRRASFRSIYWMLRRTIRWWQKPGLVKKQRSAIVRGTIDGLLGRGGPPPV